MGLLKKIIRWIAVIFGIAKKTKELLDDDCDKDEKK